MKKFKKYLLFPLSFLAVWFTYLLYDACYHKFWLDFDPKAIYTIGMVLWSSSFLLTVVVAILIRRFFKTQIAFGIEMILLLAVFVWSILEYESLEIVLEDADRNEFLIVYDQQATDRLKWRLSENEVSLFSIPLSITNRRRLTIENDVEITKREPRIYIPLTSFYTSTGEELEFQRNRYRFINKDERPYTVDYYYEGGKFKHQDSLLKNSALLARVKTDIEEKN